MAIAARRLAENQNYFVVLLNINEMATDNLKGKPQEETIPNTVNGAFVSDTVGHTNVSFPKKRNRGSDFASVSSDLDSQPNIFHGDSDYFG
jgi:hypothetical protein